MRRNPISTNTVFGCGAGKVLQQNGALFELLGQRVAVLGVARKCPCANDQPMFLGDRETHLDAGLVGLPRLAFADAFDLWRMLKHFWRERAVLDARYLHRMVLYRQESAGSKLVGRARAIPTGGGAHRVGARRP